MHMHGFYFEVDSLGDGLRETSYAIGNRQRVVTQLLQPGSTMAMTWTPERAGNWLFHCHIMEHVSPERRLAEPADAHAGHHQSGDASAGMAGLILGVTVLGSNETFASDAARVAPRRLTLTMRADMKRGPEPAYGFALTEGSDPQPDEANVSSRTDAGSATRRASGDHPRESPARRNRDPLAWHGARQLLRWRPRLERRGFEDYAAHRTGRHVRRPIDAAADRHFHLPHASARQSPAPGRLVWCAARSRVRLGLDLRFVDRPRVRDWQRRV